MNTPALMLTFFFQGFLLGLGPCLLTCAPVLVPYIAATRSGWREGLYASLVFSLTKFIVYVLFGTVFGYVGSNIIRFYSGVGSAVIFSAAGLLIIITGLLLMVGKGIKNPFCRAAGGAARGNTTLNLVVLGLVIGIAPCAPMIAVMIQIALLSKTMLGGALYAAAFGLGTVLSPLLILGTIAGWLPEWAGLKDSGRRTFDIACGAVMIFMGAYFFFSARIFF